MTRVRITWLAHAAFVIRHDKSTIYIDPRYMKTHARLLSRFFEHPDVADVILFTHEHADHCHPSSLKKLVGRDTLLAGPERCAKKVGGRLRVVSDGELLRHGTLHIRTVPAYSTVHFRRPGAPWHVRGECVGYIVTIGGKRIYHAGDTDFIPEMKSLGSVDVALLPIDGRYNMDVEDASRAALAIKPRIAVPMHALHSDPIVFKEKVEAESRIRVVIPQIGEDCATL